MTRWILNVALLSGKELRSVMKDVTLMALILFAFTVATINQRVKSSSSIWRSPAVIL